MCLLNISKFVDTVLEASSFLDTSFEVDEKKTVGEDQSMKTDEVEKRNQSLPMIIQKELEKLRLLLEKMENLFLRLVKTWLQKQSKHLK